MKIYISATFRDLQKHREAVSVVLRRMGHQVLGMEEYVAEGMRPLDRCLEDVRNCDAYIGILAWRYGYVPKTTGDDGATIPKGTSLRKTSMTEFEFRQAIDSKKTVLFFLLDPEGDWPSSQFDAVSGDGDRGRAVLRLRQEIGEKYLVSYFRSPEELAALVSAAVYRAEMSRQIQLDALAIEARFNEPFRHGGSVSDTSVDMIKDVIAGPEVQALQIDIGRGKEWWLTRLYFLASLAADLTSIGITVFTRDDNVFVGVAHPQIVRERLSQENPSLERYENALRRRRTSLRDMRAEVDSRATLFRTTVGQDERASPEFVTSSLLERRLSNYLITQGIDVAAGENPSLQMQRLIDWPMRFVPVVEEGRFARVVDKQALTDQVARLFVREQISRALSTLR